MKGRGRLLVLSSLLLNVTSINALSNNLLKEAFNVTTNKYYNLGKYIQYDDTYLNNIKRSQIVGYEYINKNNVVYMDDISFINSIYAKLFNQYVDFTNPNILVYEYKDKVRTYFENGQKVSTKSFYSIRSIEDELYDFLNNGDILYFKDNYYIYIDEYFYDADGLSYNYDKRKDIEEGKGAIRKLARKDLLSTNKFLNNNDYVSVFRPINVLGEEITENAKRMLINQNLTINKTSNKNDYIKVGDKITYTISIKNNGKTTQKINFVDYVPYGTSLVNGELVKEFDLAPNRTETISYTVVVNEYINIINNQTLVNGELLNSVNHKLGVNLSKKQENDLITSFYKFNNTNVKFDNTKEFSNINAKLSNVALNYNPARFISAIYYNAFNVNINFLSSNEYDLDLVVPNLSGGTKVVATNEIKRKIVKNDLKIGDIINYRYNGTSNSYLYIGENKLVGINKREIVIKSCDDVLEKLISYESYQVLRPSLKYNLNNQVVTINNNLDENEQSALLTVAKRYINRIQNNMIVYDKDKRQLDIEVENTKYLDENSLLYNIYYNAFKISIPSTTSNLLNTKNEIMRVSEVDNINNLYLDNLVIGDIIAYKESSKDGIKGKLLLYLGNDTLLRYNEDGLKVLSLGDLKKEGKNTVITDFKILRISNKFDIQNKYSYFIDSEEIIANNMVIELDEEKEIKYVIMPENVSIKDVTIDNQNENIVSVKNGVVKGLKEGKANLVLLSKDNTGVHKHVTVNVIGKEEARFESKYYDLLDNHVMYIKPITNAELDTAVSSDSNLFRATIEDGKVKVEPLGIGLGTLKVKLKNGNIAETHINITKNLNDRVISFENRLYTLSINEIRDLNITTKETANSNIRFEVDKDIIEITPSLDGKKLTVKAKKAGEVQLRVIHDNSDVDEITIKVEKENLLNKFQILNLRTSVRRNLVINKNIKNIYSGNEDVVEVSKNGTIKTKKAGKTIVRAVDKNNKIIDYVINVVSNRR